MPIQDGSYVWDFCQNALDACWSIDADAEIYQKRQIHMRLENER